MFVHTFKRNPPSIYNNNNNNTKLGKFFSSNPQTKRNLQRNVKIGPDKIHFLEEEKRERERTKRKEKKKERIRSLSARSKEYEGLDAHFRGWQLFSITLRPLSKLRRHRRPTPPTPLRRWPAQGRIMYAR